MVAVSFSRRWFWLVAVVLATSCVGGPVSDLPHSGDNGSGPSGDGNDSEGSSGGLDAGSFPQLDAGGSTPTPDDGGSDDDAGIPTDGG